MKWNVKKTLVREVPKGRPFENKIQDNERMDILQECSMPASLFRSLTASEISGGKISIFDLGFDLERMESRNLKENMEVHFSPRPDG
jgi:hypothetical protein